MKKIKKKKQKGQALVETALILPFILLILMAIIDFGFMFNNYMVINNAAREGARYAAVGRTDTEIRSILGNITASLKQSNITITISPSPELRKNGDEVSVKVDYGYEMLTPILAALMNDQVVLHSNITMRLE